MILIRIEYPDIRVVSDREDLSWPAFCCLRRTWLSAGSRRPLPGGWSRLGGIMFGLSVDTRSYLLLLVPVFLWWIFRNLPATDLLHWFGSWPDSERACAVAIAVLEFAGCVPLRQPPISRHEISEGLVGWWWEKFVISARTLPLGGEGNGLQWSMLFFVGIRTGDARLKGEKDPEVWGYGLGRF